MQTAFRIVGLLAAVLPLPYEVFAARVRSGVDELLARSDAAGLLVERSHDTVGPSEIKVPWGDMAPVLKTGDLILFGSAPSATSTIIKIGTWSEYTHVAVVLVMRYNVEQFTWNIAPEQDHDTVLCMMEVANHDAVDIVTADKYHGFQVVRLLDKVGSLVHGAEVPAGEEAHTHPELFDYERVTVFPLKAKLDAGELNKLQSIVSCFHISRTRYEKGKKVIHLAKMVAGANKKMDMTSMFCSDFVAYIAQEMGWVLPDGLGAAAQISSKNVSPQDFLTYISSSKWDQSGVVHLDISSAVQALSQRILTAAEQHTFFPEIAPQYFLKRSLQYERELQQCDVSKLTYLGRHFGKAYRRFKYTLWDEIRGQMLWGGEVTYVNGNGDAKPKYVRLVARVNSDGTKSAVIYYGEPGTGWYPNRWLKNKELDVKIPYKATYTTQDGSGTNTFEFKIADANKTAGWIRDSDGGRRSMIVDRPGQPRYGLYVKSLIAQLYRWASQPVSKAILASNKRPIFVFPSVEVRDLMKREPSLQLPSSSFFTWVPGNGDASVSHVLHAGAPEPPFKLNQPLCEGCGPH